ncbi:MAG: cycloinulo-oligosaccharide fructanotransferase [Lentisphaerae bacterium]|nr:cycloinulo-oligosaccharide fructanotransferase [Lentisphaerota bacterium]
MRRILVAGVAALGAIAVRAGDGAPAARWTMASVEDGRLQDARGRHHGRVHGTLRAAPGAEGGALAFDGSTTLAAVPAAPELSIGRGPFTVAAWVNTHAPAGAQRMIVAKNDYQAGRREWGLMLDADGRFRFYARGDGWKTISGTTVPKPGEWHHVAVSIEGGRGRLYVDGKPEGGGDVPAEVVATEAPLSLGGVRSGGRLTQEFHGALDEVALYRAALAPAAIASLADRRPPPHKVEPPAPPAALWEGGALPRAADATALPGVRFRIIKPYEFGRDGYRFLHGVALAWHKGRLYASFGHNRGGENTDTEEARVRISDDGGATWGPAATIDPGDEPGVGVSHGVFLSHAGRLWAFHGAYTGIMKDVHARAYVLNETDGTWERRGTVVGGGFWPLGEPVRMDDGNWIMAGIRVGDGDPAAVAISRGDGFTTWDLVVIPKPAGLKMWGESAVIVDGKRLMNIARCDGKQPVALVAFSEDYGRTWTESRPSNLPMAASKPCAGTLSTGQRFLICSTTSDGGNRRSPLTIALSRPGETTFSEVFVIRHAVFPEGPGESHERVSLAYPCAVEHDGKLYVGYSNSGGGVGRVGEGRELWNNNSAELAVIPVAALADTAAPAANHALLDALESPGLFRGDESKGCRDPMLLRHDGALPMFFTAGEHATKAVHPHLARRTSRDLRTWSRPRAR